MVTAGAFRAAASPEEIRMNHRRHSVSHLGFATLAAATALAFPALAAGPPPLHSFPAEVSGLASNGKEIAFSAPRPFENKTDLWRSLPSGGMALAVSPLFEGQTPHTMHPGNGVAFIAEANRIWRVPAQDGAIESVEATGVLTPLGGAGDRLFALENLSAGTAQEVELVTTSPGAPLELIQLGRVGMRGASAAPYAASELVAHRGEWVFAVSGSRVSDAALDGIWATNGKVGGTRQLVSLGGLCVAACRVERLASKGTKLFFSTGEALWALGPSGPPTRFAQFQPFGGPSPLAFTAFGDMVPFGRYLFFAARTGAYGVELWFSDGTAKGTRLFKSLRPGFASSDPEQLVASGGRFFFIASDGAHGRELWSSNGKRAGTRRLSDISPGPGDGIAPGQRLVGLPGGVAFTGSEATNGAEPWLSDGTLSGTAMLADVKPGPSSSNAAGFTAAGGKVYFKATSENGNSLFWVEHPIGGGGNTP
jgi:ELWxxDGT repeat protein